MAEKPSSGESLRGKDWDVSVCGLNCARCKIVEKGECQGCRGPLDKHWSPDCKVLACVKEKGYKTCAECPESETCEMLQSFYASGDYKSAQQTLERIREVGVEQWAKEQEGAG